MGDDLQVVTFDENGKPLTFSDETLSAMRGFERFGQLLVRARHEQLVEETIELLDQQGKGLVFFATITPLFDEQDEIFGFVALLRSEEVQQDLTNIAEYLEKVRKR